MVRYRNHKNLNKDQKVALLSALDSSKEDLLREQRTAYHDFKSKTVAYYLSTEEIATNHLNYLPVPGKYEACIRLEETGGKAWAL